MPSSLFFGSPGAQASGSIGVSSCHTMSPGALPTSAAAVQIYC